MEIGIIILNYKSVHDTMTCVDSVIKNTKNEYSIYIVDNCSMDGSYERLLDEYNINQNVTDISSKENNGYSAGNNIGIRKAIENGAEAIAIMNTDVVLENNAFDIMSDSLYANNDVGVVGPSVIDANGIETQLFKKEYDFKLYLFSKKPLVYFQKFFKTYTMFNYPKDGKAFKFWGMTSGCCFMMKKDIIEACNLLDEGVFLYGEERIFAYKLARLKQKAMFEPRAIVCHGQSCTISRVKDSAFICANMYLSQLYYLKKYLRLSKIKLHIAAMINSGEFYVKALYKKDYKSRHKEFQTSTKEILKMKTENYKIRLKG